MLGAVGMTIRGEPAFGRGQSRHNLVSGRSKDLNHDAVMRIGSEAPKRRTHSSNRHESQGPCRDSATSNHHRRPSQANGQDRNCRGNFSILHSLCRTQNDAVRYNALPNEPPQGNQKLARQGHDHGLATPRAFSVRARNHCAKALFFWNMSNRHANWIMPRRTRALPERASPFSRHFLPLSSGEPVRPA